MSGIPGASHVLRVAKHDGWAILNVQTAPPEDDPIGAYRDPQLDAKVSTVNRKFERPVTAQAAVLTELRQRIIRGELQPGQAIRQEVLASELGVSRLPVREALVVLQSERLVDYTQHKGYVVAVLDEQDLLQTYELRDTLESIAVAQAIPQLTDENLQAMRDTLELITRSESPTRIERIERNREFYFHLFAASGNRRLISLLSQLWDACDRYRALSWAQTRDLERVHRALDDVIRAAETRDVSRVREVLAERRESGLSEALRVVRAQHEGVTGAPDTIPV
jgi:DNA-binding GntR family transcriptional regulator